MTVDEYDTQHARIMKYQKLEKDIEESQKFVAAMGRLVGVKEDLRFTIYPEQYIGKFQEHEFKISSFTFPKSAYEVFKKAMENHIADLKKQMDEL